MAGLSGKNHVAAWESGQAAELEFWSWYLRTRGLEWPEEFAHRIDPAAPLQDGLVLEAVERTGSDHVAILDVGAGPLTYLGKTHPTKTLQITAIDALADGYDRLLREHEVEPPIRTISCPGEELLGRFGPETFDIAFARNAIDHTVNPLKVILNMVEVVRPGGFVVLRHFPNEAETAAYEGLHQWNIEERDGHLVLWRPSQPTIDVSELLTGKADISCRRGEGSIDCVLTKLCEVSPPPPPRPGACSA